MKIVEWFKNLLSRTRKKDYMLDDGNSVNEVVQAKKEFVPKVEVNNTELKKSREDIIRSLRDDMIVEDLSEEYNYTKFSPENIRGKYDIDSILSDEDITAISCLYGAIKEGNMRHSTSEIVNGELKMRGNEINDFLKKSPDNIIVLINLMLEDAKNMYEGLDSEMASRTSKQGLIVGSYTDVTEIIKNYDKENDLGRE